MLFAKRKSHLARLTRLPSLPASGGPRAWPWEGCFETDDAVVKRLVLSPFGYGATFYDSESANDCLPLLLVRLGRAQGGDKGVVEIRRFDSANWNKRDFESETQSSRWRFVNNAGTVLHCMDR